MTAHPARNGALVLRPQVPGDTAALIGLWVRSWQEAMPEIDFSARRTFVSGVLAAPDSATWVAAANTVLGFVTVEPAQAYLHQLAVAPEAKGQGIAVALLDAAKALLPDGLTLDVNQANARAVRFYEREGFVRVEQGVNAASGLATWRMTWAGRGGRGSGWGRSSRRLRY